MDLNHTKQGSLLLCNVSIAWGRVAEYKLCVLWGRHQQWFVLCCISRRCVGELPGTVYGRGDHLKSCLPSLPLEARVSE